MDPAEAGVAGTGWDNVGLERVAGEAPTGPAPFPPFTLEAGECVAVHEGDDQTSNGQYHLYAGDRTAFNASWNPGLDGACLLRNAAQTPIDFVRWRDANGLDNGTPTPARLSYAGLLDTP